MQAWHGVMVHIILTPENKPLSALYRCQDYVIVDRALGGSTDDICDHNIYGQTVSQNFSVTFRSSETGTHKGFIMFITCFKDQSSMFSKIFVLCGILLFSVIGNSERRRRQAEPYDTGTLTNSIYILIGVG